MGREMRSPGGDLEEVLDEGSDELHPQLDVAVRPLERGAGHLTGPLVQELLLLRRTQVSRPLGHAVIQAHFCSRSTHLLQLALQLLVLRNYGDLGLQVTVNRAVTEIRGAD